MNWDDLKLVLAIARAGSLGKAARALSTTQPTVGRRLDAFERRIGVNLFERTNEGVAATLLGSALIDSLARMEDGALAVERRIAARDTGLQGQVTVTSLDWVGDYIVAPIAAAFGASHPLMAIELLNDGRMFNLARREADVSIRFRAFSQEDLIERRVADVSYGLYVSEAYLDRFGEPDFANGCRGHSTVMLHEGAGRVCQVEWLLSVAPEARVALRASGIGSHLATVESGTSLAALPRLLGDQRPGLRRLVPPMPEPRQPIYLGVHPDMRDVPRIRAFIDYMVEALRAKAAALAP